MSIPFPTRISYTHSVSPMDYGAKGDGTTNDKNAVLSALQSGFIIDGGDRTYAVAGTLQPSSFSGIRRLRLKQLTPKAGDTGGDQANTTVKTLYLVGFSKVDINRLEIDCGGDFTAGYVSPSFNIYGAGLKVQDCSNVTIINCDVFNGGTINGIQIQGSAAQVSNITLHNNIVRDFHWSAASVPGDDVINGIWVYNAADVDYRSNKIFRLYGYLNGNPSTPSPQRSRGHVFSLIRGLVSTGNIVDRVDQGFDHTGSDGVRGASFTTNYASNCCSAGFKWANSQRHISIIGNVAEDCGRFGFIFSPKSGSSGIPDPGYMDVVGNRALNPGKPSVIDGTSYVAGYSAGFDVEDDHPENGQWPRSIRFIGNTAYDDQTVPTMMYGFYNAIQADDPSSPTYLGYAFDGIEGRDNKSVGHTIAADGPIDKANGRYGLHQPFVVLTESGGDSVPDSTWTSVNFGIDPDIEDSLQTHDHSHGENQMYSPINGWAQISYWGHFIANATGRRGARVMVNGVEVSIGGKTWMNAPASDDCWLQVTCMVKLTKGDAIKVDVYQSSGGALSLADQKLVVFPIERKW